MECCFYLNLSSDLTLHKASPNFWLKLKMPLKSERTLQPSLYCYCDLMLLKASQHIEAETNGRHFADDIFKCIFLNENVWIPIKISLNFVPKGPINNIPTMVQIMAWRRPGDKPLSEPMMVSLPTHICVARPQWVKQWQCSFQMESALPLANLLITLSDHSSNIGLRRVVLVMAASWHPPLIHLLDKMAAISQTMFSDAISWLKVLYFGSNFTEVSQ